MCFQTDISLSLLFCRKWCEACEGRRLSHCCWRGRMDVQHEAGRGWTSACVQTDVSPDVQQLSAGTGHDAWHSHRKAHQGMLCFVLCNNVCVCAQEVCVTGQVRELSLWEWRHWQNTPLPTHRVEHSERCLHFTSIMEHIDRMRQEEQVRSNTHTVTQIHMHTHTDLIFGLQFLRRKTLTAVCDVNPLDDLIFRNQSLYNYSVLRVCVCSDVCVWW